MVEWCKSRARARWVQEVHLLDEEMDRVFRFSESMAKIWDARGYHAIAGTNAVSSDDVATLRESLAVHAHGEWDADEAWAEGVRAYARKQAWIDATGVGMG